jgi:hypothetical protein
VTATNTGDHPVRITSAGLLAPNGDDSALVIMQPLPGRLPGVVAPRDSGFTWVARSAVEARGVQTQGRPLVGWVDLATGERVLSKPKVLVGD